jgi:hypothetical protein
MNPALRWLLFNQRQTQIQTDFSVLADGAIPGPWLGAGTAAIASGKAVLTPTLGNEILADGGMENWNSATDLTSWLETLNGTSTINREGANKYAGNYACRFDLDASDSEVRITYGGYVGLLNRFYEFDAYGAASNAGDAVYIGTGGDVNTLRLCVLGTSYALYQSTFHVVSANQYFIFKRSGAASHSLYMDNASVKLITTNTMFRVVYLNQQNVIAWASAQNSNDLMNGVSIHLDSYTNPQNGVFAGCGLTKIYLYQFLAGTLTMITSFSYTPVSGAVIKLIQNGITVQVWYNGAQVGTDQTIDASVLKYAYHGLFSTSPSCSFNSFGVRQYA